MFEIYFDDLIPETQERLLKAAGVNHESEMNWDTGTIPIGFVGLPDDAYKDDDEDDLLDGDLEDQFERLMGD